ncbi:MAG: hemolysin [Paracoccus denitrificans]|nr:MAG: hemolysin [Paracoccus denitrificans]PZO86041.1 MAG: hemolysin [Paracoccus denitrificans]
MKTDVEYTIEEITIIPCFVRGTLIDSPDGSIAVEDLRVGDLVVTKDHGLQSIRWIGSKKVDGLTRSAKAIVRPIRIRAGALGPDTPAQDLLVSPQHRILVRSTIVERMFNTAEVLVAAKQLLQVDGIDVADDLAEVEYFHLFFDQHEIIVANGAETESLYPGREAIKALPKASVEELFTFFPELRDMDHTPVAARLLPSGRQARKMAVRHVDNGKPLVVA